MKVLSRAHARRASALDADRMKTIAKGGTARETKSVARIDMCAGANAAFINRYHLGPIPWIAARELCQSLLPCPLLAIQDLWSGQGEMNESADTTLHYSSSTIALTSDDA